MTLSGRKVLITGANRGVGASFVEAALARQASTVYAAARNLALLPRFSDPARVVPVRLDVTDQQAVTAAARERTDVDLLISNARTPVYSASKAACLMLALAAREELRGDGATVTIVLPGFIDTGMAANFDRPKASPLQIAERSLDGWLAGRGTVWPDRFAELVRDAIGQPYEHLLDEPRKVMTDVQAAFMDQGSDG
jgi:NAD(P)-dependent dehydrogenase (short-subunit alcohol dehydrogenase family)